MLGLGLNLYSAAEVVASMAISGIMTFILALTLTSMWLIWHAIKNIAGWARVSSRNSPLLTCLTAELARPRTTE
jgi:hypothetical protein